MKNLPAYTAYDYLLKEDESFRDMISWLTDHVNEKYDRGLNLKKADLQNINLQYADLNHANLHNSNCHKVDFSNAYLQDAYFGNSNLNNVNFSGAEMKDINLVKADCSDSDFEGNDLERAYCNETNFQNANLKNTNFSNSECVDAKFDNANISGMNYRGALVKTAQLEKACTEKEKIKEENEEKIYIAFNNINWNNIIITAYRQYNNDCRTEIHFSLDSGKISYHNYPTGYYGEGNYIVLFEIPQGLYVNNRFEDHDLYTYEELEEIAELVDEGMDEDDAIESMGINYEERCIKAAIWYEKEYINDKDDFIDVANDNLEYALKELYKI